MWRRAGRPPTRAGARLSAAAAVSTAREIAPAHLARIAAYDKHGPALRCELPDGTTAASVHRGEPGRDGPVIQRIVDPGSRSSRGAVVLPPDQRPWLLEGRLWVVLQTADGSATWRLQVPSP